MNLRASYLRVDTMKRGLLIYGVLLILLILGQGLRAPAAWTAAYRDLRLSLLGFQTKTLEIKDPRFEQSFLMSYRVAGVGPQIVILHDLSDDLQSWYDVSDQLVKSHQVILMGLANDDKNVVFDFLLLQESLSALLHNEYSEQRTLIGHGFGAQVILRRYLQASEASEKGVKLVLISPLGFDKLPQRSFFMPQNPSELAQRDEVLKQEVSFELLNQDRLEFFQNRVYEQLYEQLRFHPLEASELSRIQLPVDLIWGAQDPFLSDPELPQKLSGTFGDARLKILESCGYAPHLECSDQLTSLIKYTQSSQALELPTTP